MNDIIAELKQKRLLIRAKLFLAESKAIELDFDLDRQLKRLATAEHELEIVELQILKELKPHVSPTGERLAF